MRRLLLSVTPYKMYTLAEERDEDDHYRDFTRTNDFLFGDQAAAQACRDDLEAFRLALYGVRGRGDLAHVAACRRQVEDRLRQVMARSERVAMCADPDAMMATVPAGPMSLQSADLASYLVRFLAEGADEQWTEVLSRTAFVDLRPPGAGGR